MPRQLRNQFVVRDTAFLGNLGPIIESVDSLLTTLDDTASELSQQHEGLTEVLHSLADYVQGYVAMTMGIEVSPTDAEFDEQSSRIDLALRTLLKHSRQDSESSHSTADNSHYLRNQLQKVLTQFHLYRKQVETDGSNGVSDATFRAACQELQQVFGTPSACINATPTPPRKSLHIAASDDRGTALPEEQPQRRIILVEDNREERETLRNFLASHGYEVTTFTDGEEALSYINATSPKATLILDMKLPKCDGATTIRRIRQNDNKQTREMRIIGMSGASLRENRIELGEGGVSSWFRKPFSPDALLDILSREVIGSHEGSDYHAA
ncbi:MAG: response regulator transcription factor [Planctomycetales bacterium]|nr:response regulator transcription factor [Planctomycetales bacterium]